MKKRGTMKPRAPKRKPSDVGMAAGGNYQKSRYRRRLLACAARRCRAPRLGERNSFLISCLLLFDMISRLAATQHEVARRKGADLSLAPRHYFSKVSKMEQR
jgi:hypothetical protein